ncbi:MAG TPA: hypothetical protein VFJ16_32385 [Longimicrobium sp.]|nr:hypothetical protein [Longimicrobium sp.]
MKRSPARVAAVTGGLLLAGAVCGAVAGALGSLVALAGPYDHPGVPALLLFGMVAGTVIGAPLLPATAWLLLRRVPLGVSFIGTTAGTVLGAWIGLMVSTITHGDVAGAAIVLGPPAGFFAAVMALRARFPAPRHSAASGVPSATNLAGG